MFGGYEGCGLQGCFTHWLWKFFEIKKCLVDYCAAFANPQFVTPLFTGKNRPKSSENYP